MTAMATLYKHTQIGYLLIAMLSSALIALMALLTRTGLHWVGVIVVVFLTCCLYIFCSLTIAITSTAIEFHFGAQFLRQRLPLAEISDYRIVTNPWYYGWGIHLTPSGWVYNVSGFDAVELTMKNGRKLRLGTDDAEQLNAILSRVLGET
jgi:hypothetical protein